MKNLIIAGALTIVIASCGKSDEKSKQEAIDSMRNVAALDAKQRTIDSLQSAKEQHHYSHTSSQTNETVATEQKKGMSNKTKGALIGTGAGVVAGAIGGALIDKENPGQGAAIGGAIGGAVGSGVGYGAGAAKDKKKKTNP